MLIPKRLWEPIQRGDVTIAFRRWKRLGVKPGRVYRTGAGRLRVTAVAEVDPATITDHDAQRSGAIDPAAAQAELRGDEGDSTYRIEFEYLAEPDPRELLAKDDHLSPDDFAQIAGRLERLDRASKRGPWTTETLELIRDNPERRAPDLAQMLDRETQPFKLDVRKLKNLGLTVSFRIGYRLSPRGEALLVALNQPSDPGL